MMTNETKQTVGWAFVLMGFFFGWASCGLVQAQDDAARPTRADELALQQSDLADRFDRLEKLMLRMAEFDQASNPRRAETLKSAYSLAKEQQIRLQLEAVMRLLNQDQYRRAITNQETVVSDLRQLLRVLEAENRGDRLKNDQARVREYIKEVERLQRMQRSVRGRTEDGIDETQAAAEQDQVAQRAGALGEKIEQNEGTRASDEAGESQQGESQQGESQQGESQQGESQQGESQQGESQQGESQQGESQQGESQQGESQQGESQQGESQQGESQQGESQQGESQQGESQQGESQQGESQQGESQQGESQQGESQQGESQQGPPGAPSPSGSPNENESPPSPPTESFPGQEKIRQAQQRMEEAQKALEDAQRDDAIEKQKEASKKLAEAKAELEEILRQMREEEIERTLAQLEARFQKMLEMQLRVNERTLQLDKLSDDRVKEIEASKLSFQEKRIVVEADKALVLLREEGSSIAFPETVGQMRNDMDMVVGRLAQSRVGVITQGIEEDIVQSLEEMIQALQTAQQEQEDRKNQPPASGGSSSPEDLPLVDALAELRMIRALQLRINKRTTRYAQMLDDLEDPAGQANDDELVEALQGLAERELRVQQITRDLSLGKNK